LIEQYLGSASCCGGKCGPETALPIVRVTGTSSASPTLALSAVDAGQTQSIAEEFFSRAMTEQLSPSDVFRITITSFLDAYNFDVRRLMKCCIHHVLPSGHVIPFCAYNVLYRDGHVSLPLLRDLNAISSAQSND
jgi:hypothetical protein